MINENDVIIAIKDIRSDIPCGTKGTVLMVFLEKPMAYLVEFYNESYENIDEVFVKPEDVQLVWSYKKSN